MVTSLKPETNQGWGEIFESTMQNFHYLFFSLFFALPRVFFTALCNIGLKSAVFNKRV